MATKQRPAVAAKVQRSATLEIDGQKYALVYDFNAIADAEQATGGGCNLIHGISAAIFNTITAAQLRGLLYAAMKPRQPDTTLAQAGALIQIDNLPAIYAAIKDAYNLSLSDPKANPPEAVSATVEP